MVVSCCYNDSWRVNPQTAGVSKETLVLLRNSLVSTDLRASILLFQAAVWLRYGECLQQLGCLKEATSVYGKVCELAPGHAQARLGLCSLLLGQGRTDEAIACLEPGDACIPHLVVLLFVSTAHCSSTRAVCSSNGAQLIFSTPKTAAMPNVTAVVRGFGLNLVFGRPWNTEETNFAQTPVRKWPSWCMFVPSLCPYKFFPLLKPHALSNK